MNFKTTIVLIVLLAVLAAWFAVDRFSAKPATPTETAGPDGATGKKLFDLDANDITKVTITPDGAKRIVLTKTDAKWRLAEPVNAAAESWEVDSLVRGILELRSRGEVDTGTGLDPARFTVVVETKAGKSQKLAVGDKTAIGDVMYVKPEGAKRAEVVSADLYDQLDKPIDDLRDKQLVTTSSADIKQITIDDGGKKIALQKSGSEWQMTEPQKMTADEKAITDITSALTGLRAADFVNADASQPSPGKPLLTVWFSSAAPSTQPTTAPATDAGTTVSFDRYEDIRKERVVVRIASTGTAAFVPATSLDAFRKKPLELRDKKVAQIDPNQVSAIAIQSDLPATTQPTTRPASKRDVQITRRKADPQTLGPVLTLPATNPATTGPATMATTAPIEPPTKWEIVSDPKGPANDTAVDALLADLNPLKTEKFTEDAPTTQPSDHYTLLVTTAGPGGTPVTAYEIHLIDPGNDRPLIGEYNGLRFEVARTVLKNLEDDFRKAGSATTMPNG